MEAATEKTHYIVYRALNFKGRRGRKDKGEFLLLQPILISRNI